MNHHNTNTNHTITMDVEQLHIILQQSFASEANLRKPAEEMIRHLKHIPGATVLLLQVVSEQQVRPYVYDQVTNDNRIFVFVLSSECHHGFVNNMTYNETRTSPLLCQACDLRLLP